MDIRETGLTYLALRAYHISNPDYFKKLTQEWEHIITLCRELDARENPDAKNRDMESESCDVRHRNDRLEGELRDNDGGVCEALRDEAYNIQDRQLPRIQDGQDRR